MAKVLKVLWRVYLIFALSQSIPALCAEFLSSQAGLFNVLQYIDIALSAIVTSVIIIYFFGKRIYSQTFWQKFTISYVIWNEVYNLIIIPLFRINDPSLIYSPLSVGVHLLIFIPEYLVLYWYSFKKGYPFNK